LGKKTDIYNTSWFTPKRKEMVMSKITVEELKEVTELRSKLSVVVGEVGQSTLQRNMLQQDIQKLESVIEENTLRFKQLLEEEDTLVKRLSEKYGIGSINFETGEFTPEK
jgi:hypothetical protein